MHKNRLLIDVVSSANNEEDVLPRFFQEILQVFDTEAEYDFRLTMFENGSTDQTWKLIEAAAQSDTRIRGVRGSKMWNLDAAFLTGLRMASGHAVVTMASDLQDPPDLIHQFLREMEKGAPHIAARITKREGVPLLRRGFSQVFYWLANRATGGMLPRNVSDFRLMTQPLYRAVRDIQERNIFLRGLVAWTGFPTLYLDIERPARSAGKTKWNNAKIMRVASRTILSHTYQPLSFIALTGLLLSGLSFLSTLIFSILWITDGVPFAGFGTLVGILTLGFSLIMLMIGVLAEYLGLVYEEVKGRPAYIVWQETTRNED